MVGMDVLSPVVFVDTEKPGKRTQSQIFRVSPHRKTRAQRRSSHPASPLRMMR